MRISPATAKFKTPAGGSNGQVSALEGTYENGRSQAMGNTNTSVTTSRSGSSIGSSVSVPSLSSSSTASSMASAQGVPLDALAQLIAKASAADPKQVAGNIIPSITAPLVVDQQKLDESWKHQAQARAILGNLIGPNGEQLTSSDPYNTTVCFLSSLILLRCSFT